MEPKVENQIVNPTEKMKLWAEHVLQCTDCQKELLTMPDNVMFWFNCMFDSLPCQKWNKLKSAK